MQAALRMDAEVAETWEALGAAYERIGRLTAALKAYERAVEVDGTRVFALAQVRLQSPGPAEASLHSVVQ